MPLAFSISLLLALQLPAGGISVLAQGALFTTPVGGLEQTDATSEVIDISGQGFTRALRVKVRKASTETNATQLTIPISAKVTVGDTLLATFWVRGQAASSGPGRVEFLFEKTTDPWTKSVIQDASASQTWHRFQVPFSATQSYAPGEAMASFRFAFGSQLVELGGIDVTDFGTTQSLESMIEAILAESPIVTVPVAFEVQYPLQTMLGFGGDFCQARYGSTDAMDVVGKYVLDHLNVVHARIGLPLNYWAPKEGEYHDDAQAAASFGTLALMQKRRIPTVLSIWEPAEWLLGGSPEQAGRVLPKEKYGACIEAIGHYLVVARDKYGAKVDFISFNEPDYGVNFKFTPDTMRDFIRQAGPRFAELGLTTKFLVGDTSGGASFAAYATPILEDSSIAAYLGPISFHCWDVLSAPDGQYENIKAVGKKFGKPIWCLEAGHDAGLWQAPNPWGTWDNALRTARAYAKTLRLSGASLMDYWTYQDNYPIVDKNGPTPYPVFGVIQQMETVFSPGARVVQAPIGNPDLEALGTVDSKGALSVLLVNSGGPGKALLSGFASNSGVNIITSVRSGATRVHAITSAAGTLAVPLPMRAVVTVVTG